ncbi:MAG: 50S ribosomal protein L10 [Phycisphaerales bacterium]|nr:50S ribosomal protein L10 [Phycisphaerales bacterium]
MSKPVKEMIIADYQRRFSDTDSAVVIEIRGMNANDNNNFRGQLSKSDIRVTIVKNTLANKAFSGGPLEGLAPALSGPSALVTGADSVVEVARELVRCAKEFDALELKAAILDGEFFEGTAGVKRLSDFPTKEEAQAKVVAIALAPFKKVVGAASAPGGNILGVVKEIQERLEKGETISPVG